MARYIDADKLLVTIIKTSRIINTFGGMQKGMALERIVKAFEEAPTADVQEVKHGQLYYKTRKHWLETGKVTIGENGVVHEKVLDEYEVPYCSECNKPIPLYDVKINYCPTCGAKMDEETK